MEDNDQKFPWISFCISTYKRTDFLKGQLALLLKQTDTRFEIVVSDNDIEGSAESVVKSFDDDRIRYFRNEENLGMIRSFNKSIERARTEYITMVTDDDPVDTSFLDVMQQLNKQYPGKSLYGGFLRAKKNIGNIEKIENKSFLAEILDPSKTPSILWSSCILKRVDVLQAGKIPDYGSPHLADHALIVMTGCISGGVIINKMYSSLTQHDQNFSKLNFETYVKGCSGFHETIVRYIIQKGLHRKCKIAVKKHLNKWFISSIFNLKRYYTTKRDKKMLSLVDNCAKQILSFPFMRGIKGKYFLKSLMLYIKKNLELLRL